MIGALGQPVAAWPTAFEVACAWYLEQMERLFEDAPMRRGDVAMTRAKDQLDLVVPQRFYVSQQAGLGDRHVYGSRTRFIPNALLAHFERTSWPVPENAGNGTPQSREKALDLAARMRAMWR